MKLYKVVFTLLLILIFIGITFFSIYPVQTEVLKFRHMDKIAHFLAYLALSFCIVLAAGKKARLAILTVTAVLYGIGMEVLQAYIPGRERSFYDFLANSVGVLAGFLLAVLLKPFILKLFLKRER